MRLAIWGSQNTARLLSKLITGNNTVVCFVDNDDSRAGEMLDGKEIWNACRLVEGFGTLVDYVIISARNNDSIVEIIAQLEEMGIRNIGVADLSFVDYDRKIDPQKDDGGIFWLEKANKPVFWYLEAVLTKQCNLKCKGCSHFASIFGDGTEYALSEFENDIGHIAQNTIVFRLRLLGGEPLLLDNLDKYIFAARRLLPSTCIQVVTNGMLIPSIPKRILDSLRDNDVGLVISVYPPLLRRMPEITSLLDIHDIRYSFSDYHSQNDYEASVIRSFSKCISLIDDNNPYESMHKCLARGCRSLYRGKIYKCSTDAHIEDLDSYFHIGKFSSSGKDIYEQGLDWRKLVRQLNEQPVSLCRYCSPVAEQFDWEVKSVPDLADWTMNS